MCVCDWELVALAVALPCLLLTGMGLTTSSRPPARHSAGESVRDLRTRHDADAQPYFPRDRH